MNEPENVLEKPVRRPVYSVVVPVYESSESVVELVERLRVVFEERLCERYEILLVDDGSRSAETWVTCSRLASQSPEVRAFGLMRNYGKAGAVLCGLAHARGDFIVTIDDDLQQQPEDIPALVSHREHDVVVAQFDRREDPLHIRLASNVKQRFDRAILRLPVAMTPLKLFKAEVARGMLQIRAPMPYIPALMASVTDDFFPVTVSHRASRKGASHYTMRRRFAQFANLLIGNSVLLLRGVAALGAFTALGGFTYAAFVVVRRLSGLTVEAGWSSLVVVNLVFSGLILLAIGIIGEYLIRILEGISHRPVYLVRRTVGEAAPDSPAFNLED